MHVVVILKIIFARSNPNRISELKRLIRLRNEEKLLKKNISKYSCGLFVYINCFDIHKFVNTEIRKLSSIS